MENKKTRFILSLIITNVLICLLCLLAYLYFQYSICFLPFILIIVNLRWASCMKAYFDKNLYILAILLSLIISALVLFICIPFFDLYKNNLYLTIANFKVLYSAEGYSSRWIKFGLIMLAVFILTLLIVFLFKKTIKDIFGAVNEEEFVDGINTIIDSFAKSKATSSSKSIELKSSFNKDAVSYLIRHHVLVKNGSGKYYLDSDLKLDIKKKVNNRSLRRNILYFIFYGILIISLIFMFVISRKEKEDNILKYDNFQITIPDGYLLQGIDNSYDLISKSDISLNNGSISFSFASYDEPSEYDIEQELLTLDETYKNIEGTVSSDTFSYINSNGVQYIYNSLTYTDHYEDIVYFYIEKEGLLTDIVILSFIYDDDDSIIAQDARGMLDSIDILDS